MTTSQRFCLLTGATSGIGQAAALSLAQQGYELFLVARSEAKASATSALITSKVPGAKITWLIGDLAKLDDVRAIAKAFLSEGKSIDLLWLNAGLCFNKRVLTTDGYEMMLGVNHLAPFLLTDLLFETLCEGRNKTRVVVTASGAYRAVKALNLDDMNYESEFKTFNAYGNSKLANIMFTKVLPQKLKHAAPDKTFTINCFHPGFVGTGIGTQIWLGKVLMAALRPFIRSSAKGAETGLFLATDPSVEGKCGGYYYNCEEEELLPHARDAAAAETLWAKSMAMVS